MRTKIFSLFLMVLFTLTAASAWSATVVLKTDTETGELYINLPSTGLDILTIPDDVTEFKVYSDGGRSGYYSSNADGYLQLVAPEGSTLQLNGYVRTHNTNSQCFSVYDGTTDAPKLLDSLSTVSYGESRPINSLAGSSNIMTLYFGSDNSSGYVGPVLTVSVNPPEHSVSVVSPVTGGSAQVDKAQVAFGEIITLTATPEEGYKLSGATFKDGNGNTIKVNVDVSWDSDVLTFAMPNSSVTVTPVFTQNYSAEGGLFVNMPKFGMKTIDIPAGVTSFKVYDDGGSNGYYSYNTKGYLKLIAPEGSLLYVSGTFSGSGYTYRGTLTIFDGDENASDKLLNAAYDRSVDVGLLKGSGREITFYFKNKYDDVYSGINMTVYVIVPKNISVESPVTGGSAQSDKTQAKYNELVTLNATPETGYLMVGASFKDEGGAALNVDVTPLWYMNEATFSMPNTDVRVTPIFTKSLTASSGLYVDMPATGMKTIDLPDGVVSFRVYDDGGSDGYYSSNADGYLKLVAPEGSTLRIEGWVGTHNISNEDYLTIYDGDTDAQKLLDGFYSRTYGQNSEMETVVSSGNIVTLHFHSDGWNNDFMGLNLLVTHNPAKSITLPSSVVGGSVSCNKTQATYGESITLSIASEAGYMLSGIQIMDESGSTVDLDLSWDSDVATFTMPNSNITITPTFTNQLTAEGGLFVKMPVTETKTVDIPAGVTSFKVYDNGGSSSNYSNNSAGYLVLNAPEGYIMQVSGTVFQGDYRDFFEIHDGLTRNDPTLYSGSVPSSGARNIAPVTNSGRTLMFYFYSNASSNGEGLDLTVTLLDATIPYTVSLDEETVGGTVSIEPSNAALGTLVTVTVSPAEGFALEEVVVTAENGKYVSIEGGSWTTGNVATFTMPYSNVTVLPIFTDEVNNLSVEMPYGGTEYVNVAPGITSFKVYDDGGSQGSYHSNSSSYLVLTAPEGYALQVTGSITTDAGGDYLTIYDGNSDSAPELLSQKSSASLGKTTDIGVHTSSTNALMLYFNSDGQYQFTGLDLSVSVVPPQIVSITPVSGGSVSSTGTAFVNQTVTLTAVPDEGYVLDGYTAYSNGNVVNVNFKKWNNTATFVMPNDAVTITPVFSSANDLFMNMPVSGTDTVVIPEGVKFIKVYDDGGSAANYSNNANGNLVLIAPEGRLLRINGSLTAEGTKTDNLTIYDGNNSAILLNSFAGSSNGIAADIGTIWSLSNEVKLSFKSDNTVNFAGLDLTVTVEDPSVSYDVSLNDAVGGSVTVNNASASVGTSIILVATPEAGYVLSEVSVVDATGKEVEVTGGKWYSGDSAIFVMPASNVSITPVFSNALTADGGLFVNMPVTGTRVVRIPQGVTSFKIYDDGGKDASYGNNVDGYLELIAPEKYGLDIVEEMQDIEGADYLKYDEGNGAWAGLYSFKTRENSLKLHFHTDASRNANGFEYLISPFLLDSVQIAQVEGGSVSCDNLFPSPGSTVSLAITPNAGYYLKAISVVNSEGALVNVAGLSSFASAVTFVMPSSSVTVTPEFSNDLTAENGPFVNMPHSGKITLQIPEGITAFKVYDDGGKDGVYLNNSNGYLELVAPEGCLLEVSGSMIAEIKRYDYLSIYDETSTFLLKDGAETSGGVFTVGPFTSNSRSLTIYFHSDNTSAYDGLSLDVAVVNLYGERTITMNSYTNGTVTGIPGTAILDETVSLTAIPDAGYVFNGVTVVDALGNNIADVGGTSWLDNTASFVMPASDVTVTPVFLTNATVEDGLYVNLPATGTRVVNVPDGVVSFKVYDDGGKDGDYSNNADGSIEFVAPEGFLLQLSGAFTIENSQDDFITVYDGDLNASNNVLKYYSGSFDFRSTGNKLTISFRSNESIVASGLNLTVSLLDASVLHDINILEVSGGSISVEETSVAVGTQVVLTSRPDDGYVLTNVRVVDSDGLNVAVTGGTWLSGNTATFVMPYKDVSVTPIFVKNPGEKDGLFINMPYKETRSVSIPEGVISFKVYDHAGKDADYRYNADDRLELTVPEGYVMYLMGTRSTEPNDVLVIYDGINTTAKLYESAIAAAQHNSSPVVCKSSGNAMTLYFTSNSYGQSEGLDFTVYVYSTSKEHTITLADGVTGGTTSITPSSAANGTPVSITTTPTSGYMLNQVVARDEFGFNAEINGNCTINGTCQLTMSMPGSNVVVTPLFSNGISSGEEPYFNLPAKGTVSVTIPENTSLLKIYDDGGKDGAFSDDADGYIKLVAPMGHLIQITGNLKTYGITGHLSIYDGADTMSTTLVSALWSNDRVDIGVLRTSNNIVLIRFNSGVWRNKKDDSGLDLTIKVFDASEEHAIALSDGVSGGTASFNLTNAAYKETITMTAIPDESYFLLNTTAVDEDGIEIPITGGMWYSEETAEFSMPNSDVTVTPEFSNDLTSLYINMPRSGTITAYIPSYVTSFKVYDDGGENGLYSYDAKGTLELNAPAGYVFEVSGTLLSRATSCVDLSIYDGPVGSSTFLSNAGPEETGATLDVGSFTGNNQKMTVYFYSHCASGYEGLDLTVNLVHVNENHHVTINNADYGTIVSNPEDAAVGETITLTASPSDGFYLSEDIAVLGCNDETLVYTGGWYSNNQITFVMPNCNVSVTPTFIDVPYVKVPVAGMTTAYIPSNLTSFKVYDNGGANGDYSNNSDGYLKLIAPEGYVMQITGRNVADSPDHLAVCNGDATVAPFKTVDRNVDVLSTGNTTTLYFYSDAGGLQYSGFDLNVTLFNNVTHTVELAEGIVGGTVSIDKTSAVWGDTVTLTTSSEEGYYLADIDAVDENDGILTVIDGWWLTGNVAKFVMPYANVVVTPVFVAEATADDARYINLPVAGKKIVNVPAGVTSFKVYDDGGKDAAYSNGVNSQLVLVAPEGKVFLIEGDVTVAATGDYLAVYDGDSVDNSKRITQTTSSFSALRTFDNVMTLNFISNATANADGLDLTIVVKDASEADEVSVSENDAVNMPWRGTKVATISEGVTSFKVYDDGGEDGDYSGNGAGYLVLIAPEGHILQLTGSMETRAYWDKLSIFDGDSLSSKLLNAVSGTNDVGPLFSSGNMMTLYLYANSGDYSGLDFNIDVVNPAAAHMVAISPTENGSASVVGESERSFGDTVSLIVTANSGYVFKGISVDADGAPVTVLVDEISNYGTAKFIMPNSDVTITPVFTTSLTESDGIFVTTPVVGRKNVVIPEGVTSFRIYDDGGPDKGCRSDATGILELTAPMGYAFQLTGSFNLSYDYACTGDYTCYNYLEINETGRSIYSKTPNSLQSIDIGTLTSNSNKITIEFHVNSRGAGGDLDVLAELVYVGLGYHVTFDVTPISNDVSYFIFGNGDLWKNENIERVMNSEENGAFPYLYRRTTDGDNQTRFDVYKWSPLLEEGGGNEATLASYTLTPAILAAAPANEANSLDITLYPSLEGNTVDYPALDIPVIAYNGSSQLTSESDYHGNVVLSQTWGGKTYTQASTLRYDSDADIDYQGLEIPSPDYADTLVFDVSTDDGIGYATVIDDFVYSWQGPTVEEGWGYNADAKTLKIAPDLMLDMEFKIHYEMLSYNVSFDIPNPESGVFVANKMTNNIVSMDWFGEGNDLTIENAAAPTVYNANGCRVAWKVKGRRVDARDGVELGDELQYMVSTIDDASAVNELELDLEHPVCPNVDNGTGPTYLQTLQVDEGNGKLVLIQKIGETVISHDFVDNQMSVPEHFDTGTNKETGVTLTVVAVPDPGYVLKQLTYDMIIEGNNITALVQDSASVNVKQNLTWHVKFSNYEPVYVAYDLSLGAEDSSNVWLPANAAWDEALAIPYDGSATEMWKPFREDLCFAGWTKDLNDADAPVYTGVDFETAGEFSKNGAEPTILYALWKPYGGDCSYPSAYTYIYPRYYEDIQDPSNYVDAFSDTLIVMQKLGDIVFMHKGLSLQVANNPYGYKMLFGILPEYGHELDTSAHLPQVAKLYSNTLSLLEGDDEGVFILGSNETNDEECYVGYKDVTTYKVVLSSNAGDATVFYGDYWTSSAAIRAGGNLPDGSIFRTDACFSGWSFDPDEVADYSFDRNNRLGTFGLSLLQQRVDRRAMGLNVDTLYAKWNAANLSCASGSVMLELAVDFNKNASVSLYQKVDGTDVKVLEIGSEGVIVPFGTSVYHNGSYYDDHIDFSKAVVTPKSGAALSDNYQLSYVDPYDVDETEYEITEQPFSFTSDAEFRLQGLTRNTYNVVYHENADDANVFYGENWSAEVSLTTDDDLSFSLYRADKCLTGWSFEGEQTKYSIADAEFVAAYEARVAAGASTDLYAVWSDDAEACGSIATAIISLSTELQNISTAELVQTVGGEAKVVATVGEEGLSIPTAGSDENIYFSSVNVVPFTGYEIGEGTNPSYKVGNEEAVEVTTTTPAWTMTDATVISGSVVPTGYSVAFDVNAGKANVFYSEDWISEAAYDIAADEDMAFPKAYRTDKCLVGYGFDKDASRDQSFLKFDTNFVKAYNVAIADGGDAPVTVYAVWNECSQELYTVTLNDVAEGTLVLTQNGKAYDVPSAGFVVPGAVSGIEFGVAFTPNLGYKLDESGTFNVVDETGAILQVLTENTLVVNEDKIVDAPVVTLENTFAFDVNAGNAVLFYGNDWVKSAMFSLDAANTDFPAGLYRVGSCLKGWALNIDAERSYKKFDEEFLADVEATKNAGLPVNKLYAVWDACEEVQTLASVENDNVDAGSFTLTRTVSQTEVTYEVAGEALMVPVPADAPFTFSVTFAPSNGYACDEEAGISAVVGEETTALSDNLVTVSGDMKLAAAVTATAYQFAIDVNAGDANVFYAGTPVTSVALQVTGDAESKTLPTNIYRSEACLNGFAFTNNAVSGFKKFDEDFIDAYDSAVTAGNAPQTLYAVWDRYCLQTLYNVTSDDLGKGELKLRQGENAFTVGSAGLQVPAVNGGLTFTVEFTPKPGYTYNELQGLEATNADGSYETIEDNLLTVTRTVAVKAASLVASGYEVVFNMNAGDATVFYGNEWRAAPVQTLYSFTQPSELPKDLYRTDSCFVGWTVVQDNANVPALTAFGNEFIEAADGNTNLTLFAKWGACDVANNATVAQVTANAGTMVLTQTDALGDRLSEVRIAGDAVTLPTGNGDVSFNVSFDVGEGYSLVQNGYYYTVDARGNNLAALAGDKLTLTGNTVLRAPILSDTYVITFNTNAGDANVFYGAGWASEGQFSMDMDAAARTYPTEVYRVGYTLVGWSLEPKAAGATLVANADGGYEGVYNVYDEDFSAVVKAAGSESVTLYAVWGSAPAQQTYHVTLADASAGYITARQTVGTTSASFVVGADGLEIPAVTGGLTFSLESTLNPGYFEDGQTLYLVNGDNSRIDSIAGKVLVVNSDKIIEIPVQTDGVQFVFSVNTNARVFYEDGWESTGYFALNGDTAFPTGVLRTEGKLLGWALSRTSTKYYTAYNGKFVEDLNNYKSLGLPTSTLYAVWGEYGVFDNVNVKSNSDKNGSFFISQVVDGVETEPIEVNAAGIQIPYSEKGISFNVKFETKAGYYINAEQAISSVDVQQGTTLGQAENGGQLVFKSTHDVALNASVDANRFKFTYNVNGGDANVFYAASWVGNGDKSLNDTSLVFPTNIYRSDACLEGWSMDSTAETGSTLLTSEFIETLDRTQNVNTLYAVWKECEVPTYKVSFANTNVGSLVLSQDLGDTVVTFNVGEEGLDVPVVAEALKFRAAYTLKPGFSGNTDSLYVVDDLNGLLTTLADNSLTVDEDITLAIPTQGQAFTLVFDVNRKGKLFYGTDWVERGTFELSDKRTSIPLPAYVYTSDACMVGWTLSKSDTVKYQKFSSDLISALQELKSKDSTYTMYAVWGKGSDCDRAYDRISLKSKNGTVTLAEAPRGEEKEYIVHEFVDDGTMIVPRTMNGNNIRVFSVPDSSYMLDSLVMTREGSEDERQVFYEGDALVFNLDGVKFEAFFGKSNRTEVAFVNPTLIKTGNAVRFAFNTSMFEVTRKVSASVLLENEYGKVFEDTTFVDSIVPPYNGAWDKFPLAAGKYVLKVTIGDERETDVFDTTFEVTAEIAAAAEESWQMISIGNLDKKAMVWDDDPKFYWWDESSASGDFWQYKEYNPKDEIVPTRGYWYSSIEGRPLVLKTGVDEKIADKVEWKLENVNSGWNLVANPYGFALNLYGDRPADNVEATEKSGVEFWRWDPIAATYKEAVTVKPYEAVWARVDASTDWIIPVVPDFVNLDSLEEAEELAEGDSAEALMRALNKAQRLVKANSANEWRIQAVLSDAKGHKDSWNMLGASSRPFSAEEPPEGMGDHVTLSVLDGNRRLAKSVKAPADEQEWTISLSANSERYGDLNFKGIDDLNALGLKVFVTVDGKTTEMHEGENLKVALRSSATKATVRVAKNAKVVADLRIDGLRSMQAGNSLNVSFVASDDLAGTRTIVEVLNMDGKVVSSRSATTLAGTNALALDAPRGGMYMLRVRAGSQMKAGRILVK